MDHSTATEKARLRYREAIYLGQWPEGEKIPDERSLARRDSISRVTVRSALKPLEKAGLLIRRQGHGTRVRLNAPATFAQPRLIAAVSPGNHSFFGEFIRHLEQHAAKTGGLVLYKHWSLQSLPLEQTLWQLYINGIRHVVIWPEDQSVPADLLRRAAAIGIQPILFDLRLPLPTCPTVSLDNPRAIGGLLRALKNPRQAVYVGWDHPGLSSLAEREAAFRKFCPAGKVIRLPWNLHRGPAEEIVPVLTPLFKPLPPGLPVVGSDGGTGHCSAVALRVLSKNNPLASVDRLPPHKNRRLICCEQPLQAIARKMIHCLTHPIPPTDQDKYHRIPGKIITL
ncbi:MAG: GntR family transcriptional regulator [Verrucomicrobiae bacterium]|nr:GntR family transcriptional regulator [Verrucomicrobiae bacterium]